MSRKKSDPILEYARRQARLLYAIEYKGRYCEVCGLDGFETPWLLDFHHKNGEIKKYEVKNKLYGGSFYNHKEEIDKCILICSNCHRTHHANSAQYKKHQNIIFKKLDELRTNDTGKISKNHFLTEEEKYNILTMINDNFIMTEISKKLNLKYCTVKSFVKRHNLNPQKRTRTKISKSIVIKMLNTKHSLRNIAKKLNINRETLRQFVSKNIKYEILINGIKRYYLIK